MHAAVVFENAEGDTIPNDPDFTILINNTYLGRGSIVFEPDVPLNSSGYLSMHTAVVGALLQVKGGGSWSQVFLSMFTQQFPRPSRFIRNIGGLELTFAIYFELGFAVALQNMVTLIVIEKERGLKDQLLTVGVRQGVYWLSWFLSQMLVLLINVIIVMAITYAASIFRASDPSLIFIIFFLLVSSVNVLGMPISLLSADSKTAGKCDVFCFVIH